MSGLPNKYIVDQRELLQMLIKHFDLHEGLYEVSGDFKLSVGKFGLAGVGLVRTDQTGPLAMDAAECNPIPAARTRRKSKASPEV